MVYGEWLHAPEKPTVLIYGHFDTQPVDPLEAWDTPPFEPTMKDGRVYARGASDDKGNMLIPILAAEALLESEGGLPLNVKFLFEGQEEIGSPQIPAFVDTHKDLLACDLVLSADGLQWKEDQPAVFLGFKGICALQIDLQGPRSDLHSGIFGGPFRTRCMRWSACSTPCAMGTAASASKGFMTRCGHCRKKTGVKSPWCRSRKRNIRASWG